MLICVRDAISKTMETFLKVNSSNYASSALCSEKASKALCWNVCFQVLIAFPILETQYNASLLRQTMLLRDFCRVCTAFRKRSLQIMASAEREVKRILLKLLVHIARLESNWITFRGILSQGDCLWPHHRAKRNRKRTFNNAIFLWKSNCRNSNKIESFS